MTMTHQLATWLDAAYNSSKRAANTAKNEQIRKIHAQEAAEIASAITYLKGLSDLPLEEYIAAQKKK